MVLVRRSGAAAAHTGAPRRGTPDAQWSRLGVDATQLRVLQWRLLGCAERAPGGVVRDRALALGAHLGLLARVEVGLEPLHQRVHRNHDEVVERKTDQHQAEQVVDEVAVGEVSPTDVPVAFAEVAAALERDVDERREEVPDERVDDCGERGADHNAGSKVDDVAAQDELPEAGQRQLLPPADEELLELAHVAPSRVAVNPAARPFAATTSAILREASSIISSPSITAPRWPPAADVECSYAARIASARSKSCCDGVNTSFATLT